MAIKTSYCKLFTGGGGVGGCSLEILDQGKKIVKQNKFLQTNPGGMAYLQV